MSPLIVRMIELPTTATFDVQSPPRRVERGSFEEVVGAVVDVEDAAAAVAGAGVSGDEFVGDVVGAGFGDEPGA